MEPVGWGHMDIAPTDASWGSTVGDAEDQVDLDIFPDGHLLSGYPGTSIRPNTFPQKYVWATLSSSDARVVATLVDQPGKATIFGYIKGTALEDGSRAPENVYKSLTSVPPFWDNHGTHVAGIAAGNGSHGGQVNRGVAVAATLFTAPSEYVNVFTHGNVINHSNIASRVSYYTESDAGEDLVLDEPWLYEDGIYKTLVVAAGNNGTENNRQSNQVAYYSIMSEAKNAIAVGNYDDATGIINPSSSMGPTRDGRLKRDVVAPGTNIMAATLFSSAFRNAGEPHTYEELSGTSMAAPHVAGIATLMHQAHRDRIPACMGQSRLVSGVRIPSAAQCDDQGHPGAYGPGLGLRRESGSIGPAPAQRGSHAWRGPPDLHLLRHRSRLLDGVGLGGWSASTSRRQRGPLSRRIRPPAG